jgi:hypothetical protein
LLIGHLIGWLDRRDQERATMSLTDYAEDLKKPTGMTTIAFLAPDAVTGELEFSLYTDDGRGNGEHVFTIPADALRDAILAYKRTTGIRRVLAPDPLARP